MSHSGIEIISIVKNLRFEIISIVKNLGFVRFDWIYKEK